jgi:hypothetical protein
MSLSPQEEAQLLAQAGTGVLPVGTANIATQPFAQTFDRRYGTAAAFTPTSTTMYMTGIVLPAGKVVTGITFVSGATAESVGSHLWFALYRQDLTFMAQATDNTGAAAFGANTAFRMALTAPQTLTYSGLYYLAFCATATMPTLISLVSAVANLNGSITGMTPIVSATSSTGLAGVAPSPAGVLTAIVNSLYAFVD